MTISEVASFDTTNDSFSFDIEQPTITDKQLDYLNDLYIFLTGRVPTSPTRAKWEALPRHEATDLIRTYWRQIDETNGRGGSWASPVDETHPAYPHLTPNGKRWVYNGCMPGDAIDWEGIAA